MSPHICNIEIICADPAKNTYLWHFSKFATNYVNVDPHEKYEMVTFYFIQNWDQVGDCLICSKLQFLSKVWPGLIWFCICPIWSLILADHFPVTLPLLHRWSLVSFFSIVQDCISRQVTWLSRKLWLPATRRRMSALARWQMLFFFQRSISLLPGGPDCVKQFQQ